MNTDVTIKKKNNYCQMHTCGYFKFNYLLWAQSDFCVWFFNCFVVAVTLLFCLNHCSLFLITFSSVKMIVSNNYYFPLEHFIVSDKSQPLCQQQQATMFFSSKGKMKEISLP